MGQGDAQGQVEATAGQGRLRGERRGGVAVFRGVPFAAPPVGALRFAAPAPPPGWDGVRDALAFGPACPQRARPASGAPASGSPGGGVFGGLFGPGGQPTSEDCLYLNVWTPGVDSRRRPVMVWLHGGAFRLGTGASAMYDGSALARRGDVVVVTFNYRLGVLGYLHVPEIGAVNLGLLDQVAALECVRANIGRFGGDPHQVTVFGESAGAKSIECLLATPRAGGLFARAIVQSTYSLPLSPSAAEGTTAGVMGALGLPPRGAAGLRDVALDDLLAAASGSGGLLAGGVSGPVVDGDIVTQRPIDLLATGGAPVPLVVGTNTDESRLFGAMMPGIADLTDEQLAEQVAATLPEGAPPAAEAIVRYRASLAARGEPCRPADVSLAVSTDRMFRQHSIRLAEAQSTHQPVWMYLFDRKAAAMGGRLGACHAIEIPFVFGNLDGSAAPLVGDDPGAADLSARVQRAWVAFAREGDPGHEDLPAWPRYDAERRATMVFDHACHVTDAPLDDERRLWEGLSLP